VILAIARGAPEKASTSDPCSTSYKWACMSSHAVSSIRESFPQNTAARCDRVSVPPFNTTETNRICLVLFGTQNRTFGPYLAAKYMILIPGTQGTKTDFSLAALPCLLNGRLEFSKRF
jgi:hypothetical protein